ncbi:mannosyltransferase [Pseudozyma hubeiensis SY62]|uniref:Mannosyltransferase n=1 Tax=Pseudozyma hubeiensis (strain SY62) TaxID=1305764 RepID=R9PEH3_PSEHS|nr:mannosyltransferase [Pseudozyma hubeiensis SY62]GAC99657.1 mannosyltransferase [Pseudozyma hubeiensis SY62]
MRMRRLRRELRSRASGQRDREVAKGSQSGEGDAYAKTAAATATRPEPTKAAVSARKLVAPLELFEELWDELAALVELDGDEAELELEPDELDEPEPEPVVGADPEAAAEPELRHDVSEPARTVAESE